LDWIWIWKSWITLLASGKASKSRYRPTAMITICKYYIKPRYGVTRLCPAYLSVKAKSQVFLCASWENLILEMQHSTTRLAKEKISANLNHHSSKKCLFLCVQTNWVCPSRALRFCKNDSDSNHWLWPDSSNSVKKWLVSSRVTIFSMWLELNPSHQNSWLESSHWLESGCHWNQMFGDVVKMNLA